MPCWSVDGDTVFDFCCCGGVEEECGVVGGVDGRVVVGVHCCVVVGVDGGVVAGFDVCVVHSVDGGAVGGSDAGVIECVDSGVAVGEECRVVEDLDAGGVCGHDLSALFRSWCASVDLYSGGSDDADCDVVGQLGVGEFECGVAVVVDDDGFCTVM